MSTDMQFMEEWTFQKQGSPLLAVQEQWTSVLLNYAAWLAREHFTQILASLHITARHFGALAVIADKGPLTQIELGRLISVDRNTMVSLTDELEQLKLVQRDRHPKDRRAYQVTLTSYGQELLQQANMLAKQSEEEFYTVLTTTEQMQLRNLLTRLVSSQKQI